MHIVVNPLLVKFTKNRRKSHGKLFRTEVFIRSADESEDQFKQRSRIGETYRHIELGRAHRNSNGYSKDQEIQYWDRASLPGASGGNSTYGDEEGKLSRGRGFDLSLCPSPVSLQFNGFQLGYRSRDSFRFYSNVGGKRGWEKSTPTF